MHSVSVRLDPPYEVSIGRGLLADLPGLVRLKDRRVLAVTDSNVARHHLKALMGAVSDKAAACAAVVLPSGEANKDLRAAERVYRAADSLNLDRGGLILALGGGVVGDVAGFAAATWCRGVGLAQLPTTLLAMADASVGGKTGVDYRGRKNGVGAFHQPEAVVMDLDLLATLPARQLSNGMAEVIKAACIADPGLLELLMGPDPDLGQAIRRAVQVKVDIVQRDPRESGERALLNFGHTFGHAIESHYRYRKWLHGEAVAIGMALIWPDPILLRVLARWNLPLRDPALDPARLAEGLSKDKKNANGRLRFVDMDGPGRPRIRELDAQGVQELLERASRTWRAAGAAAGGKA